MRTLGFSSGPVVFAETCCLGTHGIPFDESPGRGPDVVDSGSLSWTKVYLPFWFHRFVAHMQPGVLV